MEMLLAQSARCHATTGLFSGTPSMSSSPLLADNAIFLLRFVLIDVLSASLVLLMPT
jgi:hypothetical protein